MTYNESDYAAIPPVIQQTRLNRILADFWAFYNGFTPSGSFINPCTLLIYTDGTDIYAVNAYQTVYGGPGNAGGVEGDDADATPVFQAALDAIEVAGGGMLFVRNGTYTFAGQANPAGGLNFDVCGLIVPDNVSIVGEDWLTTILTTSAIPGGAVSACYFTMFVNEDTADGNSGFTLRDLSVVLPAPVESATGMEHWDMAVFTYGLSDSLFSHCYFEQGGVWLQADTTNGNTPGALINGHNYNNIVEKCSFKNITGSCSFFQASNCIFRDNIIDGAWDDGLLIGSAGLNHKIYGNKIINTAPVNGKGADTACIYISNDDMVAADETAQMNHQIFGNTLCENKNHDTGSEAGIYILNGKHIQVFGNIIYDCSYGVTLDIRSVDDLTICDNDIYTMSQVGIRLQPNPTYTQNNIVVRGNRIDDCAVQGMRLYSNGEISRCKVLHNIFTNNTVDFWTSVESGKTLEALIADNSFTGTVTVLGTSTARVWERNKGFVTDTYGAGSINNTSMTIPHGLAGTPHYFVVTWHGTLAGEDWWWTADATNVVVTFSANFDTSYTWHAKYIPNGTYS